MEDSQSYIAVGSTNSCKPLIDSATPEIYLHNSFRITGLVVDAGARDIKRRLDDIQHAEETGAAESEHDHLFALKPPPNLSLIRDAAQKLKDPITRFIDEFFWFWPAEWGKGYQDKSIAHVKTGNQEEALKYWEAGVEYAEGRDKVIARHNVAVAYHLMALDGERKAVKDIVSERAAAAIHMNWKKAFQCWEELQGDELFWSIVSERIRLLDDPRLTTGFARRFRSNLPEAMDRINAMLAIKYAEMRKLEDVKRHITYMNETHVGLDDVAKSLEELTKSFKSRVDAAIEKSTNDMQANPTGGQVIAQNLIEAVREPLRIMEIILGISHTVVIDYCDAVVDLSLKCHQSYCSKTDDWSGGFSILAQAEIFARSETVKKHLSTVKERALDRAASSDPRTREISNKIESFRTLPQRQEIKQIFTVLPPLLKAVELADGGQNGRIYKQCADLIAIRLRALSVDMHNNADANNDLFMADLIISFALHDTAMKLAVNEEIRSVLHKDAAALKTIRQSISAAADYKTTFSSMTRSGALPAWPTATDRAKQPIGSGQETSQCTKCGRVYDHTWAKCLQCDIPLRSKVAREASARAKVDSYESQSIFKRNKNLFIWGGLIVAMSAPAFLNSSDSTSSSSSNSNATRPLSSNNSASQRTIPVYAPAFDQPEQSLPESGEIVRYDNRQGLAPLEIIASNSSINYFIKISDAYSGKLAATLFLRAGTGIEVEMPLGNYTIKYAAGSKWYGDKHLFGPKTIYTKSERTLRFFEEQNSYSGVTLTLKYTSSSGDGDSMAGSRISAAEF